MENPEYVKLLNPARFPGMSGRMAAIVGYILERDYTDPAIDEMAITSDGMVLARERGDVGLNDFIGDVSDLERNWNNLLDAAGLNAGQRRVVAMRFRTRITDWRRS